MESMHPVNHTVECSCLLQGLSVLQTLLLSGLKAADLERCTVWQHAEADILHLGQSRAMLKHLVRYIYIYIIYTQKVPQLLGLCFLLSQL